METVLIIELVLNHRRYIKLSKTSSLKTNSSFTCRYFVYVRQFVVFSNIFIIFRLLIIRKIFKSIRDLFKETLCMYEQTILSGKRRKMFRVY